MLLAPPVRQPGSAIRTAVVTCLLAAMAGACGPHANSADDPAPRSLAAVDRVSFEDSLANGVNAVPATQMRAAMRARYRLHPDRRLLLAIADIHHTLTGESLSVVRVRRGDGVWAITYKNRDVGTMPDVPTYHATQALLDAWTTSIAKDRPVARPSAPDSTIVTANHLVADYTPARLFEALRLIDSRWATAATRDPALLAPAARALVGLVMQGVDETESADVLAGRAFAYVSLARTLSGDRVTDADALLAWLFQYTQDAKMLADSLPATHIVRQLVTGNVIATGRAAFDSATPRMTQLAHLRVLAAKRKREDWANAIGAMHIDLRRDPEAAATGLLLGDFALNAGLPFVIERGVVQQLAPAEPRVASSGSGRVTFVSNTAHQQRQEEEAGGSPATTLPKLDARVRELAPTLTGPALDTTVYASFHRALLHSAYLSLGLFHLQQRADYPAAVAFGKGFDGLDSSSADAELGAWYSGLATAYANGADRMTLINDLARYRQLSGVVLQYTFDAMRERARPADPRRARMARLLTERLDTRPTNRPIFAVAARDELLDAVAVAQVYGSGNPAFAREDPAMAAWIAAAYRDTTTLRAIVSDTGASAWARSSALRNLAEYAHLSMDEHKQYFERIIADAPRDWDTRGRYIKLLRANHDYVAAEKEARDYLGLGRAEDGFDVIAATVSIGNTFMEQGRYREAYSILRPAVETYQGGAMAAAVKALARGGKLPEAEALADKLVARYPDVGYARAGRLEVWWRQSDHAAVAKEIREQEWIASEPTVAEAFIAVFGEADERAAGQAAYALVQAEVPVDALHQMGSRVEQAGRKDLAFELASRGTDPNPMIGMFQTIAASRLLVASRGQDAAVEWLRERLPMPIGDDLSFFLVDQGHNELLWSWEPNDRRDEGRYTWLMRALVAVRAGLDSSAHRQELLDHYATPDGNPYYTMGRFLVGLEQEDAVLALATTIHRKCEISFYLGARARAEGRFADAVDWFRVAVETAQLRDGEYYWAVRELVEMSRDPRGLIVPSAMPGVP